MGVKSLLEEITIEELITDEAYEYTFLNNKYLYENLMKIWTTEDLEKWIELHT